MRAASPAEHGSAKASEDETVVIAERYAIEARIGHGTSGSVYRAHDRVLDRRVALKLLEPGAMLGAEHEARILAAVGHRNVVTIHDLGRDSGRRYLVLELLDGPSLTTWLATEARAPATVLATFIEAGRGLAAAHAAGLVHRDFKPANVILDERGRVVVVDFGLAEHATTLDGERQTSLTRGTLAYMAPEQLDGVPCDARSDQFSFCVALWEALTGAHPFTGDDPLARYRSIIAGPPTLQSGTGPRSLPVSRHIVHCLERGLSFEPSERFESMDALLDALETEPRVARARRSLGSLGPVALAVCSALAFVVGWGIAGSETLDAAERASSFDPRPDAAAAFLAEADRSIRADQPRDAVAQLVAARQLAADLGSAHPSYCELGQRFAPLAAALDERAHVDAARLTYALALRFAQDCPAIEVDDLLARREAARATDWTRPHQ